MSDIVICLIVCAALLGAAWLGMRLRSTLPQNRLSDDLKTLIQAGLGIIGTMAGIVLGLLVSSAAAAYDAQRNDVISFSSNVVLLDRVLASYGPDTRMARRNLRGLAADTLDELWPKETARRPSLNAAAQATLLNPIEALSPKNEEERSQKGTALAIVLDLAKGRWLLFEQRTISVSAPVVVVLISWFIITFAGLGLVAPSGNIALSALALCALAIAGAIFLVLELYTPFQGLIQLSSAPMQNAIAQLGQ